MNTSANIIITISRQQASGGAYIGYLLAKRLGYRYVEREILLLAAKELGVDMSDLARQEECCDGFVQKMMKGFMYGTPEAAYIPPARRPIYDRDLFDTESRIIKAIADSYDAVIVGRGGYSLLARKPNALHVFVYAPMSFRIERLRKYNDISVDQAKAEIEDTDKRREKYLGMMTKTDWCDARNYHLSIDAGAAGFETAEQMILDLVERKKRDLAQR